MSFAYSRRSYCPIIKLHHDLKKGGKNKSKLCLRGKWTFRRFKSGYLKNAAMKIMGKERSKKFIAPGSKYKQFLNSTRLGESTRTGSKIWTGPSNKFSNRWGHSSHYELKIQNHHFAVSSNELLFIEVTQVTSYAVKLRKTLFFNADNTGFKFSQDFAYLESKSWLNFKNFSKNNLMFI